MDVKEGHCWRCETPLNNTITCQKCSKAKYCGEKCRLEDEDRHEPQCEIWKSAVCSCPGCEVSGNLLECSNCFTSPYCSATCQRKHWSQHKQICRQRLKATKENTRKLGRFFVTNMPTELGILAHRKLDWSYYTGNVIAVDMLHLQTNELLDAVDASKVLRKDYSILSAGCGNLRHLIYTITSLPEEFVGNLRVTLNDVDPFIQARNVLFIFMMQYYSNNPNTCEDIASKITTIWYSLHLPDDTYEKLKEALTMLCTFNGALLKIMTQGMIDITDAEYGILRQVWLGWMRVDEEQASGQSQPINKQRDELLFGNDLQATKGFLTSFTAQIPERHGQSIEAWVYNGDMIPSGKTAKYDHLNPTLTGRAAKICEDRSNDTLTQKSWQSPSEVEFEFCVPLCLMPFADWDYRQASTFSTDDSLLVMYHAYITNQLQKAISFLTDGRLSIRINVRSCLEIKADQMSGDSFDRIFTSNLVDYLGTKTVLDVMKPLLNTDNKHAVIVTQYWNWYHYFPMAKVDNPIYHQNGWAQEWIKSAIKDTLTFLPFTPSQHYYQEYFNNTPYFIDYLRADLKACRYVEDTDDLSCDKIPTFKQVKQCSGGLRMRDFRQDLNKVAPWRYRCNVRAVNMLPGYSRMLEWYLTS